MPIMEDEESYVIHELSQSLVAAKHTTVFTGAGMSTESGLPDFRSSTKGLWKKVHPETVASVSAMNENVQSFIDFYYERMKSQQQVEPHAGHTILAVWEKQGLISSIITQNVDGLHQDAGSSNVIELHGTLRKCHCNRCGKEYPDTAFLKGDYKCACGGLIRPSVVLFGESLPFDAFYKASEETEQADLFIVLGSSLSVTPANQFPLAAKKNGAKLVIVNMEPTELDYAADLVIRNWKIGELLETVNRFV
ncbi:NAD-dependent deacetylase [Weizmannia acidilactici]|uniref:NAD-dependent protein deacetylase n=2 Tax=Weizmannia acidilactici TaxID=2607726 RepID=A0A5J4J5R3_9BACI|nr:NAD-dependent deacetylase [Weizmannia acidilactici]GER70286.1 NAD-dependent deacetylase [Weizmannia acidilactici]GER74903.1 NAD-dependent deacetylase [Weizmannia acidilactici]